MKKHIIIALFLLALVVKAQVVIGKDNASSPTASLEFGTENRGLLLPWVSSSADLTTAIDGTLIFDSTDKKVKYKRAGTWTDLTVANNGVVDLSLQNGLTEQAVSGVKIGTNAENDATAGVLVLTDADKAMVLPKVNSPHLNIINPSPGMIVYDNTARQLAVFNGTVWSYWRP